MKSFFWILLQTMIDESFECGRDVAVCGGEIWRILFKYRAHRVGRGIATKRTLAGKHFIHDRTEGENIGPMIYSLAAHLFGRHIAHCTHYDARASINTSRWYIGLARIAVGLG